MSEKKLILRHTVDMDGHKIPVVCFPDGEMVPGIFAVNLHRDVISKDNPAHITFSIHLRALDNELEKLVI